MSAKAPPATPARSAARPRPGSISGTGHAAPSPLSPTTRITRPAAPSPRRGSSAVPPTRASPQARATPERPSSAGSPERPSSRSSFYASLARETEEKEALMVKVQELEATIVSMTTEMTTFNSAIVAAEARITELYEEQTRMEDELASRNVVTEKLRNQVHELERDERDLRKRYNDQTQTFDAERQAFYDSEQHLKSRIQSLTQARNAERLRRKSLAETADIVTESYPEDEEPEATDEEATKVPPSDNNSDQEHEPPEVTALKLELSTLTTSYTSSQSTLQLVQVELQEERRVNQALQEENESYQSLLMERTMTGQFDIRRSAPSSATWPEEEDGASLHGTTRSNRLEAVSEVDEQRPGSLDLELAQAFSSEGPRSASPTSSRVGRKSSRRGGSTRTASPKGETLADLPVAGPGLDLAAELGRAEANDINGFAGDQPVAPAVQVVDHKEFEAMRAEIKALKDANKALSLYASKILDRIIGHGGFESVLAADGEASPQVMQPPAPAKKARPQSMSFLRSFGSTSSATPATPPTPAPEEAPKEDPSTSKRARRGLSIDWSKISIWASPATTMEPPPAATETQPTPTQTSVVGAARKLDLPEDEEDKMARARLNAEMRLLGIEKEPPHLEPPAVLASSSTSINSTDGNPRSVSPSIRSMDSGAPPSSPPNGTTAATTPTTSFKARLPFFSRGSSSSSLTPPEQQGNPLTPETLQQAEAEANIAASDARERLIAEEIAKEPLRPTSLTEMPSVRPGSSLSERHRRRRSGGSQHSVKSGTSTLFSAGRMSTNGDLGEEEGEDL